MISVKSILVIVSLLVSGTLGYYAGYSPVPQLRADVASAENINLSLQSQVVSLENENAELMDKLEKIVDNLTSNIQDIDYLSIELKQTQRDYVNVTSRLELLLLNYYNLLLEYQGIPIEPEGEMKITKIPGIENGGFDGLGEGWVLQGKGGKTPYANLWQWDSDSYVTQTVQLLENITGIVFDVKPEPVGASVTLELRMGDTVVFSKIYEGSNSQFTWKREVVRLAPLFRMREEYGFNATGYYEIKFTVPSGIDNSAKVLIDNVSLAKIEYIQP